MSSNAYAWRKPSLLLLIKLIGRRSPRAWRPLASALEKKLPQENPAEQPYRVPVWPRFAVWLMEQMRPHVPASVHLDELKQQLQALLSRKKPSEPKPYATLPQDPGFAIVQELLWEYEPVVGGRPGEGNFRDPFGHLIDNAAQLLGMKSIARGFLLSLQLAQPPRDQTEASLQQAILKDESQLPIYCDYLEVQGDPVAVWLRMD